MAKSLITHYEELKSNKEYKHHRAHAIVGLYVISHFIYRYASFFLGKYDNDMSFDDTSVKKMGFVIENRNFYFFLIFLPHFLVQLSGFGFEIPRKRHPDGNRIWPQYRFEALVFFGRCMSLLYLAWLRKANENCRDSKKAYYVTNYIIVMLTIVFADLVKEYFKRIGEQSNTIRGLHGPPGVLYLMSSAQFHATLHSLITSDRLSVQIAALTVVQLSAFGMTLRRKGLITQQQGVILYGLVLVIGMIVIFNDLHSQQILYHSISFGNIAALLRFEFGINKYILWTIVMATIYNVDIPELEKEWLQVSIPVSAITTFILFLRAYKLEYKLKKV